jgi:hypothetical protein
MSQPIPADAAPPFDALLADLKQLEGLYDRDRVAQRYATEIERIFDRWLHDAPASPPPLDTPTGEEGFPVYQAKEWQCRYVFPDGRCCWRLIDHDGDHKPAEGPAVRASGAPQEPEPCKRCGGMGTHTIDILVGGTEHDTEELECVECKGTGIAAAVVPSPPAPACQCQENQRRQLEALGLLGEFAPSVDLADAMGEAILRLRASVCPMCGQPHRDHTQRQVEQCCDKASAPSSSAGANKETK